MRLIDVDSLKGKEVHGTIDDISGDFIPAFEIVLAPTVDAALIQHARWILKGRGFLAETNTHLFKLQNPKPPKL